MNRYIFTTSKALLAHASAHNAFRSSISDARPIPPTPVSLVHELACVGLIVLLAVAALV